MFLFFLQRPAILCSERQQNCHSGRAVHRSVNQGILFASPWTIGGRYAGHFDGPKRLVSFGRNRFAGRREWNLSYDYFTLPPGCTKENEPTTFFQKLCLCRRLGYWATAGLGSRSPVQIPPKVSYGKERSLAGFTKWEYGSTDVWDLWRMGLVSSNEISN